MGCGSSKSLKAINEELDQIRDAVWTGAGVAAYVVNAAGTPIVNGVYVRDGKHDGKPCFRNQNCQPPGQIWLCKHHGKWLIGDKDKLDDTDGDYYDLDGHDEEALPDTFGWECCKDGIEPVPKIDVVPEGPVALVVEGAGKSQANGTYVRSGTYDGAPRYVMNETNLCIYRSRGNTYRWMIAHKKSADEITESAGDLYQSQTASEYPPSSRLSWEVEDDGQEPPPSVRAVDAAGNTIAPGWITVAMAPATVAVQAFVPAQPVAVATPVETVQMAVPVYE